MEEEAGRGGEGARMGVEGRRRMAGEAPVRSTVPMLAAVSYHPIPHSHGPTVPRPSTTTLPHLLPTTTPSLPPPSHHHPLPTAPPHHPPPHAPTWPSPNRRSWMPS